jgi:hypothetical protein
VSWKQRISQSSFFFSQLKCPFTFTKYISPPSVAPVHNIVISWYPPQPEDTSFMINLCLFTIQFLCTPCQNTKFPSSTPSVDKHKNPMWYPPQFLRNGVSLMFCFTLILCYSHHLYILDAIFCFRQLNMPSITQTENTVKTHTFACLEVFGSY